MGRTQTYIFYWFVLLACLYLFFAGTINQGFYNLVKRRSVDDDRLFYLLAGVLFNENHLSPVQNILPIALPIDRFVTILPIFFAGTRTRLLLCQSVLLKHCVRFSHICLVLKLCHVLQFSKVKTEQFVSFGPYRVQFHLSMTRQFYSQGENVVRCEVNQSIWPRLSPPLATIPSYMPYFVILFY